MQAFRLLKNNSARKAAEGTLHFPWKLGGNRSMLTIQPTRLCEIQQSDYLIRTLQV